jgi:hypothetical protein
VPAADAVTWIENTQLEPAAMVAPDKLIVLLALTVTVPPHTVELPLATVRPAGSVAVKATPVKSSGLAAGLVTVNDSVEDAPSMMVAGLKAMASTGGPSTIRVAEAELPVVYPSAVTAVDVAV